MKKWEVLDSSIVFKSEFVSVRKDKVKTEKTIIEDFYSVIQADAVMIIALDDKNNILLKREYRHSLNEILIEAPAGTIEKDEVDSLAVAKRELLEETGFVSNHWTYLGNSAMNVSKNTNYMHIYLAENIIHLQEQQLDAGEDIECFFVSLDDAVNMCLTNEIFESCTVASILKVAIKKEII